jgi:F-type H+-transporting ATPase subunit epsilon
MAETTQLELVTPSSVMFSRDVEMVVIPASEGLMGVLPRHAPVLAGLSRGIVEIHGSGKVTDRIMIDGGLAEVGGEAITILAERAVDLSKVTSQELSERAHAASEAEAEFLNEAIKAL